MPPLTLSPSEEEDALRLHKMDNTAIADRIAIMRIQEETTYRIKDYIADSAPYRKRAAKPVDSDCRVKMAEWCYSVVDFCKFKRETVATGMNYLDRYLCSPKGRATLCNRKEYQLASMTALYIAIKLHEPLEMETSLLADLSRGCYTQVEFVRQEQTMLKAMHWRVNGPTCLSFLAHFMALLPSSVHPDVAQKLADYARYQVEIAVADQSCVFLNASEVALAAILNAMEGMDPSLLPLKLQARFLRYLERHSEIPVTSSSSPGYKSLVKTQCKLSMLLSHILLNEINQVNPQLLTPEGQQVAPPATGCWDDAVSIGDGTATTATTTSTSTTLKSPSKSSSSSNKITHKSPVSVIRHPSRASTTSSTSAR